MEIYCVKDNKANHHGAPFFQGTHTQALRIFRTEVNRQDNQNMIYLYPAEYDLVYLGKYDENTGQITPVKPEVIANGNQLKNT